MRRVVVAFDYLYIDLGFHADLDIATGVYSQKVEDLVFFVLPLHGTIEDFQWTNTSQNTTVDVST